MKINKKTQNINKFIWAGVVLYFPDENKLLNLITSLSEQVNSIVLYDNGGAVEAISKLSHFKSKIIVIGDGTNMGIGFALNEMFKISSFNRAKYLWTFDQDSSPDSDLLTKMIRNIDFDASNERVAAYSPVFADNRGDNEVMPMFKLGMLWVHKIYPNSNVRKVENDIMITSGMLVSVDSFKRIGPFREDFFIDHVDTEWCLRALRLGYKLYSFPNCIMSHELSDSAPRRLLGRLILEYGPTRRYYQFRNTIYLSIHESIPFSLRLYYFATILYRLFVCSVTDIDKVKSFRFMIHGIYDGLTNKLGKIRIL